MAVRPYYPELLIGRGCDSSINKAHGWAITFKPEKVIGEATGLNIEAALEQITSSQQLAKKLDISASASFSGFGFSASAEAKYLSQEEVNRYNTFLLVRVKVKNPAKVISHPEFKPEARTLLETKGWEEFEKIYGPEYVSGIITGGSYYGIIRIATTSREEQQKIVVKVSASGWGASLKGKLDKELREVSQGKEVEVTIFQSGGSGDPLEVSIDEMIEQFKNFPTLVKTAPVVYQVMCDKYRDTVPRPSEIPGETSLEREHRNEILEELGQKYLWYKDYRSNLRYVLDHILDFEEYQSLNDAELQIKKENFQKDFEEISNQINELVKQARRCHESISACELPSAYYQPIEPLPEMEGQNMMLKKLEEEVAKLRQAIAVAANGNVGIGAVAPGGYKLRVDGSISAGNSDLYFTKTDHNHTGIGNTQGYAAIENAQNYDALMILGRAGTAKGRYVRLWDYLQVNGGMDITGNVGIGTTSPAAKLDVNGIVKANSLKIGSTEISEAELSIVKRLANSQLKVGIKSRKGYYIDNYRYRRSDGDSDRTIQFQSPYNDNCEMTLEIK